MLALFLVVAAAVLATSRADQVGTQSPRGYFRPESLRVLYAITDWDAKCEQNFTTEHMNINVLNLKWVANKNPEMRAEINKRIRDLATRLEQCIRGDPRENTSESIQEDLDGHDAVDVAYFASGALFTIDQTWANGSPADASIFQTADNDPFNLKRTLKGAMLTRLIWRSTFLSDRGTMLFIAGCQRIATLLVERQAMLHKELAKREAGGRVSMDRVQAAAVYK